MGRVCNLQCVLVLILVILTTATMLASGQGTRVGFYGSRCPNVESIVRSAVLSHFRSDPTIAPSILRMHFHDCFVRGCDASILIVQANSERTAGPNRALKGFEAIDDAKTQLEAACPGVVSCADILALAAREAVVFTRGLTWAVPLGRRDGTISQASDVSNLPGPFDSVAVQKQKFADKNLNTQDLVALVGGHTIGTAGCGVFRNRFFNFNNTGSPDPSIDRTFVPQIQALCPLNGDASRRVALDTGSENQFDNSFFSNVRSGRGILQSDQVLWNDPETRTFIQRFLGVRGLLGLRFGFEFGRSMVKMSNIEVKTGTQGEIRRVCSAVN